MQPRILDIVQSKGYAVFTRGAYNLNIIGVRSASRVSGEFDDRLHVVFKDTQGCWIDICFKITTDAGLAYMHSPMRDTGTAILVAGQYRGAYKIDKHRGKYDALCQRGAKVKIYRDNNRDEILDHDPDTISTGWFGINIHRSHSTREVTQVGKYSAGCQVFPNPDDFALFMALVYRSAALYGDTFTYTLLEE